MRKDKADFKAQKRWRDCMIKSGKCVRCGQEAALKPSKAGAQCLAKHAAYMRAQRGGGQWKDSGLGRPPTMTDAAMQQRRAANQARWPAQKRRKPNVKAEGRRPA